MIMARKSDADILTTACICRINSMERNTRGILRNKIAGPVKRKAVKGYLVHRSANLVTVIITSEELHNPGDTCSGLMLEHAVIKHQGCACVPLHA